MIGGSVAARECEHFSGSYLNKGVARPNSILPHVASDGQIEYKGVIIFVSQERFEYRRRGERY